MKNLRPQKVDERKNGGGISGSRRELRRIRRAFGVAEGGGGPTRPYVGFRGLQSTTKRQSKLIEKAKEHVLPRIPRQQPIDDPPPATNNLCGHLDHGSAEGGEFHAQQFAFLVGVLFLPTALLGQRQGSPGFQAPGQRGHHHVGPVARKVVDRRRKRPHAAFELPDEVLLIATSVGREDDLFGRRKPVVGDVEETSRVVEQLHLALGDFEILPGRNHAIGFLTQRGRIFELGDVFSNEPDVFELAPLDDLILGVGFTAAGFGFRFILGTTNEPFPRFFRQFFGFFIKCGHGVDAKHETNAVVVPAVEVRGLGKGRIAAERDFFEARPSAQCDCTIEILVGVLLAGPIAATIVDVERFARVGQRYDQGMIAPCAVVGDVHALLAFAVGFDQRSVGVDDGLVEELLRLSTPDRQSRFVERFLQEFDPPLVEASAKVASSGGVGNPSRAERVEISLVVPQQLDVLQASAAGQQVVSDVEHMVRLVVRQMHFQQMKVPVNRIDQPDLASHQMHGPNASGSDGVRPLGDFIMNIAGRKHRLLASTIVRFVQTPLDLSLASTQLFLYPNVHSKTFHVSGQGKLCLPYIRPKTPMVFEFFNAA